MAKPAPTAESKSPGGGSSASAASEATDPHWADQVTDLIVDGVDKVRDRTVNPIQAMAKYVVYGAVIAVLALPMLVLSLVLLVRILDAFLPGEVWLPYLILGALFVIAGMVLWAKRTP
ncbi:MAG: hypothetical protein R2754_06765 [Microthrixaceae bacterium]